MNKDHKNYKQRRLRRRLYKLRVFIARSLTIATIIVIIASACWIHYVDSLCTDIYKATDYYLTSSIFNSKKLSKIDTINLEYCDSNSAVVQVYGLGYDSPHVSTSYTAYFTKAKNNSWKLDNIYIGEYKN